MLDSKVDVQAFATVTVALWTHTVAQPGIMNAEERDVEGVEGVRCEEGCGDAPPQKIFRISFRKRLHFRASPRAFKQAYVCK